MHECMAYRLFIEGLCVRWNKGGDHYAIMFDRQINIYNVTVSLGILVGEQVKTANVCCY